MDPIDVRRLRGLLAEAQVTTTEFARVCKLHRVYVGQILSGRVSAGQLARIKLARGMTSLGLDREAQHAS